MLIDVWGLMKSYVSAKDKSIVAEKFVDIAMDTVDVHACGADIYRSDEAASPARPSHILCIAHLLLGD